MTLEWFQSKIAGVWTLRLMDNTRFHANLGSLHAVEGGYVIFHTPYRGSDPVAPCYLPADLTLDEAKSAAKLILATGGEHGRR
jgi:hypothetical protein